MELGKPGGGGGGSPVSSSRCSLPRCQLRNAANANAYIGLLDLCGFQDSRVSPTL